MALKFLYFFPFFFLVHAQNISTTTPVPPLQWINLSNLLQGSSKPPPLKDAAIGYDETSRSLIIFGGVSEGGIPQSQTFLLNLQTLSWSTPSPPATLQRSPPSRSAVVSGSDFAASNRQGFVVIGGKGSDGKALSDIWEYDFNNQFWSQVELSPGGPSPRWGASGGIDLRIPPHQDPIIPGPNNTLYLAGGFDGTTADPLSDVWRLNISGTLSSNLPDDVKASWDHLTIDDLPGRINQGGTVISRQIVTIGGCMPNASPTITSTTCATQGSFVVDVQRQMAFSPGSCPAPRLGPVLVPNLNAFSSAFASQAFLLLGIFNTSLWRDSDGLSQGEVAILDINTATWTRVLPSGDPNSSEAAHFPSPRQGAAAVSFSQALVGDARNSSSDTIIFGGQDANGIFLSDVWLLRAYYGIITPSSPTWSGFGNGRLQTGINADGSGVRVNYLTECATSISQSGSNSSNSSSGSSPSPPSPTTSHSAFVLFNTSFLHKLLLPLSLVILMPVILGFRWTVTTLQEKWTPSRHIILVSMFMILGFVAYALGIAGFVVSFTTISSSAGPTPNLHLRTAHGISGVVFFICLYALVPFLCLSLSCFGQRSSTDRDSQSQRSENSPNLIGTNEKVDPVFAQNVTPSVHNTSPPSSPRLRTQSWDASNMFRPSIDGGMSNESSPSSTPHRGFEVLNRPNRARKLSGPWSPPPSMGDPSRLLPTRSLGEIDWLLRRRSLNAVGELDYVITQAHNAQVASSNADDVHLTPELNAMVKYPKRPVMVLHILIQVSIFGLSVISLVSLWQGARRYFFAMFLIWTVAFYVIILILGWYHRPAISILSAILLRLQEKSLLSFSPSAPNSDLPKLAPGSGQSPYTHHRPPCRPSTQADELSHSHSPLSVETDYNDDDIDEDTRQRLIEEEMDRRDVSIVTVPRRKLLIANPS